MSAQTGIAWTDHTWSPWRGCARVSPGCENCYAETLAKRFPQVHGVWGTAAQGGVRIVAADASWARVRSWDRNAAAAGVTRRIFPSMCDPFEEFAGHVDIGPCVCAPISVVRDRLFALIESTPHLTWLLLTKRPENVLNMVPPHWIERQAFDVVADEWPANCAIGVTCEDHARADDRVPMLLGIPAPLRFVSVEPQLEYITFQSWLRIADAGAPRSSNCWIIQGGESGPHARPFDIAWARDLRDQCRAAGVTYFFKQLGEHYARAHNLKSKHGADPSEWPDDMRVQEFP